MIYVKVSPLFPSLLFFFSLSVDYWYSSGDGGAVCLPTRPQAPLGGVPEQVL